VVQLGCRVGRLVPVVIDRGGWYGG